MAYDPVKAHEYYVQYRKKGKKKGRKKGKSEKKTSLIGLSTAGLNDAGKMQWAMEKEALAAEMNEALKGAKTPEERQRIRSEYQNRALQALQKIKSNPSTAQAKKSSSKSGGSKVSGSKSSGGSGSKEKASDGKESSSEGKESSSASSKATASKASSSGGTSTGSSGGSSKSSATGSTQKGMEQIKKAQEKIDSLKRQLENGDFDSMPEEQKEVVRQEIRDMIEKLRKQIYG